jgi:hypothetical protein
MVEYMESTMILAQVSTEAAADWTSLEAAKLAVSMLTPLSVILLGFWVNRRMKRLEHLQWANQKVVEKRLQIFDELMPPLNDLLCYYTYIGSWKDLTPPEVVALKRKLDRLAYVRSPLLPAEFLSKYNAFMNLCFSTYGEFGSDARLRTHANRRQQAAGAKWQTDWSQCFVDEAQVTDPQAIRKAYSELVAFLVSEMGVGVRTSAIETGNVPEYIR